MSVNILFEFEKRYKGDVRETKAICASIADNFGLNVIEVEDYVYINRYAEDDKKAEEMEREDE